MKKDFSQPFQELPAEVSLIINLEVEGDKFVLVRNEYESLEDEHSLPSITLDNDKDATLQIAKYLHRNGLAATKLRQLCCEQQLEYGFIDDTPGSTQNFEVFLVHADLVQENPQFIYVDYRELHTLLSESSLVADIELAALNYI